MNFFLTLCGLNWRSFLKRICNENLPNSYKSTPSVPTQTTTFDESFTPKSKLFNKTVFKKTPWSVVERRGE